MKLLLTALLLVHTVQSIVDDVGFSQDSCLDTINSARAVFAKKLQIANMNSLQYNTRMEAPIYKQLDKNGCPEPSIISHSYMDIYLNVKGREDLIVDLLSEAGSTMLACVKTECNGEPIVSIVTDFPVSRPISGAPGTQCPYYRPSTSNGLCFSDRPIKQWHRKTSDLKVRIPEVKIDIPLPWRK